MYQTIGLPVSLHNETDVTRGAPCGATHSQKNLVCQKCMILKYWDILGIRTRTNEKKAVFL